MPADDLRAHLEFFGELGVDGVRRERPDGEREDKDRDQRVDPSHLYPPCRIG